MARTFGVTRQAVSRFVNQHPALKAVADECRETFVDNVESALYKEALGGNVTAQIFILKTLGKTRGYVERQEITGKDGGPLTFAELARQANEREEDQSITGDNQS